MRLTHVTRLAVWIVLLRATVVAADGPWEAGVDEHVRVQAQKLFEEGNQLFAQQAHKPALEKYRAAIALWDHPLIRLNMAITELQLDRVLDAADDLDAALRYGAQPFREDEYAKALIQQRAIASRVGHLEVSCTQAGARVALDGESWVLCPGHASRRVLAGRHLVLGQLDGHVPISRRIEVAAGAKAVEELAFVPIDQAIQYEYPTPHWIPWTVAASGAAVVLAGVGLDISASRQMERFDDAFAKRCRTGCAADLSDVPDLRDTKNSAETKSTVAITAIVAGGVTLAAGVVWAVWFDRPRRVVPVFEVHPTDGGAQARVSWQF